MNQEKKGENADSEKKLKVKPEL